MAEREQGITIDVAYRYFTTDHRSFIVADTPGHEEYTRNMAVGASFAQLAIVMVDAKQGVLVQTRRHARICALMGIRYFVFAVNKMDLVGYDEKRFREIEEQIRKLAGELSLSNVTIIPVSATEGDNVTKKSENIPWYTGKALLPYLEDIDITEENEEALEEEQAETEDSSLPSWLADQLDVGAQSEETENTQETEKTGKHTTLLLVLLIVFGACVILTAGFAVALYQASKKRKASQVHY